MAATAELVVRVVADTASASTGLNSVSDSTGKMTAGIKKAAVPAAAALAALGAAAISAGNAAADDAQAAAILAQNLKNSTGATEAQIAATEEYIDKMAKATGVADDALRPAMANLARGSGDAAQAQKDLAVALDVAAATGNDVETVSKAIAKAYGGSTTSLKKLVPSLDAATLASGDMTAIMGELGAATEGSAGAAADTTAGQMARMQVSMQEAQEEIGSALLPALSALAGVLASVAGWAQEHPKLFLAIAIALGVMAAAILVLNVALGVYTAVTTLAGSATLMAWIAALWPILLVIAAIAAVIAIVVLLWKHCETFRNIVTAVWEGIKTAALATWNWIKTAAIAVWNAIQTAASATAGFLVAVWNKIKSAVETVVNGIQAAWEAVIGWLRTAVSNVVEHIKSVWQGVKTVVGNIADAVKSAWDTAIDGIKSAVSGLGAILSAPFDAVKSAIQWVIDKVNDLKNALSSIKVPKINLPGPLSLSAPAPAATARGVMGYAAPGVGGANPRAPASGAVVINVTGALDPEAVARQIKRVLAGHDRRMGLTP